MAGGVRLRAEVGSATSEAVVQREYHRCDLVDRRHDEVQLEVRRQARLLNGSPGDAQQQTLVFKLWLQSLTVTTTYEVFNILAIAYYYCEPLSLVVLKVIFYNNLQSLVEGEIDRDSLTTADSSTIDGVCHLDEWRHTYCRILTRRREHGAANVGEIVVVRSAEGVLACNELGPQLVAPHPLA